MATEPNRLKDLCVEVLQAWFNDRLRYPDMPAACLLSALQHYGLPELDGVSGPADGDPPMDKFELWVGRGVRRFATSGPAQPLPARETKEFVRLVYRLAKQPDMSFMIAGKLANQVTIEQARITPMSVYFKLRVT